MKTSRGFPMHNLATPKLGEALDDVAARNRDAQTEDRILRSIARGATRDLIEYAEVGELGCREIVHYSKMWMHTLLISLACHLRCAVANSSARKPEKALLRPYNGVRRSAGVEGAFATPLVPVICERRPCMSVRRRLSTKTMRRERLSLKYSSNLTEPLVSLHVTCEIASILTPRL